MDWAALFIATALFVLACGALLAEIFFVSFGALALISVGLAAAAVTYAFYASPQLGWSFLIAAPVVGGVILHRGLLALAQSPLVPKAIISDDAGTHHQATAVGALPGVSGILVTAARPTGRARFAHGEIDVHCDRAAERGETVLVQRCDGPNVFVSLSPAPISQPSISQHP